MGFGISTPEQAGAVAKIADGVVVGSAIVRLIEQNAGEAGLEDYAVAARGDGCMTREEAMRALAGIRKTIDAIDLELLELLNRRTTVVEEIGRAKESAGMPIYEPKREADVFRNVTGHNRGPLTSDAVKRIFERIIDEMRTLQRMRREQKKQGENEC